MGRKGALPRRQVADPAGTALRLSPLRASGFQGPTILVIDDGQWLDGSSAALVEHLLSITTELPLLICVLGRSGEMAMERLGRAGASLPPPASFIERVLQPLTVEESGRDARRVAG